MAAVCWLAFDAVRLLGNVETARSDNAAWSLAQVETEHQSFILAMDEALLAETPDLDEVRRRFDVFYSRVQMLTDSHLYNRLAYIDTFRLQLATINSEIKRLVPLIDRDDAALYAALPTLRTQALALQGAVRDVALVGPTSLPSRSEEGRREVARSLAMLVIVTALLLIGISLLAVTLLRLYRIADARAETQRVTSARMQAIVETSSDAILVTDHLGQVIKHNSAAKRTLDLSDGDTSELTLAHILPPTTGPDGQTRDLLCHAGKGPVQMSARRADGQTFPAEVSIQKVVGTAGPIHILFVRDITRQVADEAELRDARDKALAGEKAKAEFLAVMSHEMRTPLNGLLGTLELIRGTHLDARQSEYIDNMEISGNLLLSHVNDVLDLAKFEAGKLRPRLARFSVSDMLDQVVASQTALAAAHGNELSWGWVGRTMDGAVGDETRMRQILLNFVNNAIKFTSNGSVWVEAECLEQGNEIEFRVYDTGIGIAPEHLERVFNDFETLDGSYARKSDGTGLGLGIARRMSQVIGGRIGAESEPDEGSLFWLRVPLQTPADAAAATASAARPRRSTARGLSVLIVEDNRINRIVAREMLESGGHRVTEAENGQIALDLAEHTRFDLILMDISMPVMDGKQAARAIRASGGASCRTPIVAVTAHALPEEIDAFRASGMTDCIHKPITRETLLNRVDLFVDMQPAAATLLDVAHLDQLRSTLGEDRLDGLLDRYLDETDTLMQRIAACAAAPEQCAEVLTEMHNCAGSSAALGLTALCSQLRQMETVTKRGETDRLSEAPVALPALWHTSRSTLLNWRAEH